MIPISFIAFFSLSISDILAFQPIQYLPSKQPPLCFSKDNNINTPISGGASILKSVLQKPSKVLTVGLEYAGNKLSPQVISTLSMQLRKLKVSAIWCDDIESLQDFVKEQETAQGNFPGPCSIIYHGPVEYSVTAVEDYGASAVVVPAVVVRDSGGGGAELDLTDIPIVGHGCEIVWKVSSSDQIKAVLERTGNTSDVFWLDDVSLDNMKSVVACLPNEAMFIASVDSMQPDGAEVLTGKEYKKMGCASIFVRRACVGDAEDLEYAQFLVGGFTSKASSEFKFTGLTGSTNGHFGGVQASTNVRWRRAEA